jgi:hypothetical protein
LLSMAYAIEPEDVKTPQVVLSSTRINTKKWKRCHHSSGSDEIFEFRHHGGGNSQRPLKGNFHNRFFTTKVLENFTQSYGKVAFLEQRRSSNNAFQTSLNW